MPRKIFLIRAILLNLFLEIAGTCGFWVMMLAAHEYLEDSVTFFSLTLTVIDSTPAPKERNSNQGWSVRCSCSMFLIFRIWNMLIGHRGYLSGACPAFSAIKSKNFERKNGSVWSNNRRVLLWRNQFIEEAYHSSGTSPWRSSSGTQSIRYPRWEQFPASVLNRKRRAKVS